MAEHTPGPWRIGSLSSYDGYTGKPFRNVWAGGNDGRACDDPDAPPSVCVARCIDNGNCDDDARLIAAAPDLLAACQRTVAEASAPNGGGILIRQGDYDAIVSAIAKATDHA